MQKSKLRQEQSYRLPDFLTPEQRRAIHTIYLQSEIALVSCVYWKNRAPWSVEWRKCPDTFFLVPTMGEIEVPIKGAVLHLKPGQFLMLPESTPHALRLCPQFRKLEQIAIHCHFHDRWGRPLLERFSAFQGCIDPLPEWKHLLQELTCLASGDPVLAQARAASLLRELLVLQVTQKGLRFTAWPETGDRRVGMILQALEAEYADCGLSVESLASRAGITPVQLRKLFRQETGCSPKQFLSQIRLREASRQLGQTPASIQEIAAACGFASPHYFHLAFRQQFQCTPGQFRERAWHEV